MLTVKELEADLAQGRKDLRVWTLVAGVAFFVIDVIGIEFYRTTATSLEMGSEPTAAWHRGMLYTSGALLGYFVALWWFARSRPVLACLVAMAGYWVVHIAAAARAPVVFMPGSVVQIGVTIGLVMAIRVLRRNERALRDIRRVGDVFTDAR